MYMKKQYKYHQELRIIKLQKNGVALKGYAASSVIFRFGARNKNFIVRISSDL